VYLENVEIIRPYQRELKWQGPFSWPGYENLNGLEKCPDVNGIYLLTFQFKLGFMIYGAGITKSTKRRFREHTLNYKSGKYTVLDVIQAEIGRRVEIWHGWTYAKQHRTEFIERKEEILIALEKQLISFRLFQAHIPDLRMKERFEAAIMHNIYNSNEPWAELADRGMALRKRKKDEAVIVINNISNNTIYGLPNIIEI